MLKHLLVLLIAPIIRRLVAISVAVILAAYVVTIPARLWVLYVDPRASECHIMILNATTSGFLIGLALGRRRRGWRREQG